MTELSLGQSVKYTNDEGDNILATIQASNSDGDVTIALPGGNTLTIASGDIASKISDQLKI